MFHKASALVFQLGSIIQHNTQSGARMHGHTLPGWRAQAGTPDLIYYRSALPATHSQQCLLLFVIRSARHCLGINGSPRKVTVADATGGQIPCACLCSAERFYVLAPNCTHLLSGLQWFYWSWAVSVRSCWILKCLLRQCRVTAGFGRHAKGSQQTIKRIRNVGGFTERPFLSFLFFLYSLKGCTPQEIRQVSCATFKQINEQPTKRTAASKVSVCCRLWLVVGCENNQNEDSD